MLVPRPGDRITIQQLRIHVHSASVPDDFPRLIEAHWLHDEMRSIGAAFRISAAEVLRSVRDRPLAAVAGVYNILRHRRRLGLPDSDYSADALAAAAAAKHVSFQADVHMHDDSDVADDEDGSLFHNGGELVKALRPHSAKPATFYTSLIEEKQRPQQVYRRPVVSVTCSQRTNLTNVAKAERLTIGSMTGSPNVYHLKRHFHYGLRINILISKKNCFPIFACLINRIACFEK